jgi:hypothetical protein
MSYATLCFPILILLGQFHTLTSAYALTGRVGLETDDFIFSIVNFPFECNSNLETPAGGVYISYLNKGNNKITELNIYVAHLHGLCCYSDSRNLWAVMKAGGLAL